MRTLTDAQCVKAVAKHLGWRGNGGGWICDPEGKPVVQGWDAAKEIMKRRGWIVDRGEPFGWHINWRRVPHAS